MKSVASKGLNEFRGEQYFLGLYLMAVKQSVKDEIHLGIPKSLITLANFQTVQKMKLGCL